MYAEIEIRLLQAGLNFTADSSSMVEHVESISKL